MPSSSLPLLWFVQSMIVCLQITFTIWIHHFLRIDCLAQISLCFCDLSDNIYCFFVCFHCVFFKIIKDADDQNESYQIDFRGLFYIVVGEWMSIDKVSFILNFILIQLSNVVFFPLRIFNGIIYSNIQLVFKVNYQFFFISAAVNLIKKRLKFEYFFF